MKYLFALLMLSLTGCVQARPTIEQYAYRIGTQSGSLCSGTAVSKDTILTAKHCLEKGDTYLLIAGRKVDIKSVKTDNRDQALVRLGYVFKTWATRGWTPSVGTEVQMVGNVDGFDQFYRRGYMTGWYGSMIAFDMTCGKGDSGSGIFDMQGRLIGMVSAVYKGELVSWCISWPLSTIQ